MTENVVEFPRNNENPQDEALPELPPEVKKQLEQYDLWIQEFSVAIDKALFEEASKEEKKRDITLPLEALIRTFSMIAEDLDNQVKPEELAVHTDFRVELANIVNKEIVRYMQSKPIPVYQQDIFLALSYVLISYLYQQRIYTIDKTHGGTTEDANNEHKNPTE